ncbi:MAG: serine/threonine-protein phosphatase, partial [Gammaproteobacteria bacterium]|nr:serine/threonine-protein phosphatase [Gammaproteobacteria bacterium]
MFVTLLYAVLDPDTGTCTSTNAGHHPALCVRRQGSLEFAQPTGPPIGVLPDATWEESELRLEPGDTIFIYTDGIVEARGAETQHERESGV